LNAVRLANGNNFKTKSKLMNRKCCYIRETMQIENITCKHVKHVSNNDIIADCFTEPLSGPTLLKQIRKFMDIQDE